MIKFSSPFLQSTPTRDIAAQPLCRYELQEGELSCRSPLQAWPSHDCSLHRCLIVGLPWGQFHGLSSSAMCRTRVSIWPRLSGLPIIILLRHALIANILLTLEGRGMCFDSEDSSPRRDTNSSKSARVKVVSRLRGSARTWHREPTGSSPLMSTSTLKPLASIAGIFCITISSSRAVSSSLLGRTSL